MVFKGKAVQPRGISAGALEDTMYAATANGWMEECIFHQWFKLMFTPHVAKVRLLQKLADSPAILFLDGHSSHTSISIIELAIENNITIQYLQFIKAIPEEGQTYQTFRAIFPHISDAKLHEGV